MDSNEKLLNFSVDYLLPVHVMGHWIGVVYRDKQCIMTLMDHHDITNKAIQCDPSFDIQSMDWFTNDINRLKIVPDVPRSIRESQNRRSTSERPNRQRRVRTRRRNRNRSPITNTVSSPSTCDPAASTSSEVPEFKECSVRSTTPALTIASYSADILSPRSSISATASVPRSNNSPA